MQKLKNRKSNGFTIIEILLVLVLLGMVATFMGRNIFSSASRGKVQGAKIAIKQLEGDLDRFRLDCNFYPTTEQGLKALISAPTTGRTCPNYDPNGYLGGGGKKKLPKDPWDNDFVYRCDDGLNYEIISLGSDGLEGGEGDAADISSNAE
jgi:general secretion pathway protein G